MPKVIAPDAQYSFSFFYTTPKEVESVDILLSLKHPSSGYTRYFSSRSTESGQVNGEIRRGLRRYRSFHLDTIPPVGEDYIWEVKILPVGKEGEDDPLSYFTLPVSVKETGFMVSDFKVPAMIEPYDSYDIEIEYNFDEFMSGYVTLISDETGEEVLRGEYLRFSPSVESAVIKQNMSIPVGLSDGDYSWKFEATHLLRESDVIVSELKPAELFYEDEIKAIDIAANAIVPGITRDVAVTYTATEDRELMFELWSTDPNDYRVVRESVSRGSGVLTVSMQVPQSIDFTQDYYWWSKLVSVGGSWQDLLDQKGTDAIVAANLDTPAFFEYPIYTFPGKTFFTTVGTRDISLKVDENLVAYDAALYFTSESVDGIVDYTLNLRSGSIYTNSSTAGSSEVLNPYNDANQLEPYLQHIDTLSFGVASIAKLHPELNDALAYVEAIDSEFTGTYADRDLYFGFTTWPKTYDIDFVWQSVGMHPDKIVASTKVLVSGKDHIGLTFESWDNTGSIYEKLTFNLETGELSNTITDLLTNITTEEVQTHPFRESDGDVQGYLELMMLVEEKLQLLAAGTIVEGDMLARPYPQVVDYLTNVRGFIDKFAPISLSASQLYFGGETEVFNFNFSSSNSGAFQKSWDANFTYSDAGEWQLETSELYPKIVSTLNFATGELYFFKQDFINGHTEYTVLPPEQGGELAQYRQALAYLIANLHRVESPDPERSKSKPQPQLTPLRQYLENILDSL